MVASNVNKNKKSFVSYCPFYAWNVALRHKRCIAPWLLCITGHYSNLQIITTHSFFSHFCSFDWCIPGSYRKLEKMDNGLFLFTYLFGFYLWTIHQPIHKSCVKEYWKLVSGQKHSLLITMYVGRLKTSKSPKGRRILKY